MKGLGTKIQNSVTQITYTDLVGIGQNGIETVI